MKRLLVTGASGLLGLNLVYYLNQALKEDSPDAGYQSDDLFEVYGVLHRRGIAGLAQSMFHPVVADLVQPGCAVRIVEEIQPDVVIHCAALTDVDYCEAHVEEAEMINAQIPQAFAREAGRHQVAFVHISTDAVFDGLRGDYVETDTPRPVNVYARTKLDGERLVAEANPDVLIARVNFYGWSGRGQRSLAEWFFNNLVAGHAVHGFANLIFSPLLVNDLVTTLLRMVNLRLTGLYHVVSSEAISKCDFGRMLARQFGFNEQLIAASLYSTGDLSGGALKAPRARNLSLRSDKLSGILGARLPGQAEAMQRFYEQYAQGYPQTLRSILINDISL